MCDRQLRPRQVLVRRSRSLGQGWLLPMIGNFGVLDIPIYLDVNGLVKAARSFAG
jgi:hypothetical protein